MVKKKVNRYSEEYRREAVSLADQPGKTAREVADALGIHVNQIYNWRLQYKNLSKGQFKKMDGVDYTKDESVEVRRLKRRIKELEEERDFLKKATAYFAKEKK